MKSKFLNAEKEKKNSRKPIHSRQSIFPLVSLKQLMQGRVFIIAAIVAVVVFGTMPYIANLIASDVKIKSFSIEWGGNPFYDDDNDGIVFENEVVDVDVVAEVAENTSMEFIATRWKIENGDASIYFFCNGAEIACSFLGLQQSGKLFNATEYFHFGRFGISNNSQISAQVMYVNYNIKDDNASADIEYSDWSSLEIQFVQQIINDSVETNKPINESDLKNNTDLACIFLPLNIKKNNSIIVDLLEFCNSANSSLLTFSLSALDRIAITESSNNDGQGIFLFSPDINYTGLQTLHILVNDSINAVEANVTITVYEEYVSPLSCIEFENRTIFRNTAQYLDISEYCYDDENRSISYTAYSENLPIEIVDGTAMITANGSLSSYFVFFIANDSYDTFITNLFSVEVIESMPTEEVFQRPAEVGKPVRWVKTVSVPVEVQEMNISLPLEASNITVREIEDGIEKEISKRDFVIIEKTTEEINQNEKMQAQDRPRVGLLVIDETGESTQKLSNAQPESEVVITEPVTEVVVEYETAAPSKEEKTISLSKKEVKVYSDIHYIDVKVATEITETASSAIKVYWKRDMGRMLFEEVVMIDTNNNSLIDKLEWIVPHLSNQTFEIELDILDIQSYPTVGGNWTVRFNTLGKANLTIGASNGTSYGEKEIDDGATRTDIDVGELRCGDSILFNYPDNIIAPQVYIISDNNQSLKIQDTVNKSLKVAAVRAVDYECDQTAFWTVKVQTPGKHTQRFDFGNVSALANNFALQGNNFTDDNSSHFEPGNFTMTNLSGHDSRANVTLNFSIAQTFKNYSRAGNFTSRTFDSGQNHTIWDKIVWTPNLVNSTDVVGMAGDTGINDFGVFYRNGSIGTNLTLVNLSTQFGFNASLIGYSLPNGWQGEDIIGIGWDSDGTADVFAFFRNGSTAADASQADLTTDIAMTTTSSYTLPAGFNRSDIIGIVVDTTANGGAGQGAVFFRNGSYARDTGETAPFAYTVAVLAYTLPAGYDTKDAIGVMMDEADGTDDIAMFFRNGSFVVDATQADFTTDIAFVSQLTATYHRDANITEPTNISMQTRVSNDSIAYSPWSQLYENDSGQQLDQRVGRYLQYKSVFYTPDKYITPGIENVTINYTDINVPNVTFAIPTPVNNSFLNVNYFFVNISIIDEHNAESCILDFSGSNQSLPVTRDGRNATCSVNKTGLADGSYGYRAYSNDSFSNWGVSEIRNITVDLMPPTASFLVLSPNPANYTFSNVTINFTVGDLYVNITLLNISWPNGTTLTVTWLNQTLIPYNLSVPGNYTLNLTVNDSAGNRFHVVEYLFVKDITPPNITLLYPGNDSYDNETVFWYLPKDDWNVSNCSLIINNRLNQTNITIDEAIPNNFTVHDIEDSHYNWSVNCTDNYNNSNFSSTYEIVIDRKAPQISIISPVNDFNSSEETFNISILVDDLVSPNATCNVTINSILNVSNRTILDNIATGIQLDGMLEGGNRYNVTCIDFGNNTNVSLMRNFTVVKGPELVNATLLDDNDSIRIDWDDISYAESYRIYIFDNFSDEITNIANVSGLIDSNYTDANGGNKSQRFYSVATVKGITNKTSIRTVGKFEFEFLNNTNSVTDWNLFSVPFNLTNFMLYNGSNGTDIRVKPHACMKSIWMYNATIQEFMRIDYNGSAWRPVLGSENFTSLEPGRGYWAEVNQTCNVTMVGEVPRRNITVPLEVGWNIVGWYSPNKTQLPIAQSPSYDQPEPPYYPFNLNPAGSAQGIVRYNPLIDLFEVTIHFDGNWGWWPSFNNQEFTDITPTTGYYLDVTQEGLWIHEPNTRK